jgi:hypothetical protein
MADEKALSFSQAEADALKQIVADWLNEEIAVPPFSSEIQSTLRLLGLEVPRVASPTPGPVSLA